MSGSITLRIPLQQYGYIEIAAPSAVEVLALANDALTQHLHAKGIEIEKVAVATVAFPGAEVVQVPEQSQPAPQPVQAAPVQPPAQAAPPTPAAGPEVRSCVHGPRTHRTGTSARGAWSAWFCPLPKGTPGECAPEWK